MEIVEEPEVDDHPAWTSGTRRRIAVAPSAMPDHIRVLYLWGQDAMSSTIAHPVTAQRASQHGRSGTAHR